MTFAALPDQAINTLSSSDWGSVLVGSTFLLGLAVVILWRTGLKKDAKVDKLNERIIELVIANGDKMAAIQEKTLTVTDGVRSALEQALGRIK